MAEDDDVGFEEGMLWLPAHVLEEACESKMQEISQRRQEQHRLKPLYTHQGSFRPHSMSKFSPKLHQRSRNPTHRASGGPGMQAIFLDSGQRSCGTGVFLPRIGGSNIQESKKPACSPVLLPAWVVQALNLNVHVLGSQHASQRDLTLNTSEETNKVRIQDSTLDNKNGGDKDVHGVSTSQYCVYPQACNSSPEIFLPKEWSY